MVIILYNIIWDEILNFRMGVYYFYERKVIMVNFIRERQWLYRGLRTFFQAFISTLATQIVLQTDFTFDKKMFFSVLASSFAGGISAVMNIDSKEADLDE